MIAMISGLVRWAARRRTVVALIVLSGCANPALPNPSTPVPGSSTTGPATSVSPFPTGFPATGTAEKGNYCALAAAWWYRAADLVQVHVFAPGPTQITARADAPDGHLLAMRSVTIPAGQQSAVIDLPAGSDPAAVVLTAAGAQSGRCVVQQVTAPLTP